MTWNFFTSGLENIPQWLLVIVVAWVLAWKGVALWISARKNQKIWFIILLIVNTMAILEILYIFLFSKLDINKTSEKKENDTPSLTKKKTKRRK